MYKATNTNTFLTYSFFERIQLTSFLRKTFEGNLLADTSHLRAIITKSGITDNPYAYRFYALALMVRSDLYSFGRLHTDQDILCIDDTVARFLFKASPGVSKNVETHTNSCSLSGLDIALGHIQTYVTDTKDFLLQQPKGLAYWSGTRPLTPEVSAWEMMIPTPSPSSLPGPLPVDSTQEKKEIADLLTLQASRTPLQMERILYWANPDGSIPLWFDIVASTTARVDSATQLKFQTITALAGLHGFIESWKLKYFYWAPRPFMRSTEIKPFITTPNFPSYPSAHATIGGSIAEALAKCGLTTAQTNEVDRLAQESADSREWGGIHFHTDDANGLLIGRNIGDLIAKKYCK